VAADAKNNAISGESSFKPVIGEKAHLELGFS